MSATQNTSHETGYYRTPGPAYDFAADGEVGYMAAGGNGLVALDVSDPRALQAIDWYDHAAAGEDYGMGVAIQGDTAYLAEHDGLALVDIRDPANLSEQGFFTTYGRAVSVSVDDQKAYVGNWGSEDIVDVADPAAPAFLGRMIIRDIVFKTQVVSDTAYVAANSQGLRIMDVSNPADPQVISVFNQIAQDVQVVGDLAYVSGYGVWILNISDPAQPVQIGYYLHSDPAYDTGLAVEEQIVYISNLYVGLYLLDVSDPTHPTLLGSAALPGRPSQVALVDDRIYVACEGAGLYIFQLLDQQIFFPITLN